MKVREAVEEYSYAVKDLGVRTQSLYTQRLSVFVGWCEEHELELEDIKISHIRRFTQSIKGRVAPKTSTPISTYTVHGYVQVVKSFLLWCGKEEDIEGVVRERLGERIEVPKTDTKLIAIFTPEHIKSLYKACDREFNEVLRGRDVAILSLLFSTGIRASELIGLKLQDVHLDKDDSYIKVFGKGRKEREVGLEERARKDIARYIRRLRPATSSPVVFLTRYSQPFTVVGLDRVFLRLEEWGNIQGVRCSPHTCRHTFAVNYLKRGGDLYKLSRLLGHNSISTTEVYLRAFKQSDARKGGPSLLDDL